MSGACDRLAESAALGVAPALRAVDCLSNEAAAAAFGRLFGTQGALLPALTILLTLYIAFFAISLLTGRSTLGISALTPRMMTLGLVLTFATSWAAWQGTVWNLVIGAPDQIAGIITGARGSATQIFADRIDLIFSAIAEVADAGTNAGGGEGAGAAAAAASGSFSPKNLMWLGALLLMLGTVGVLLTARIALGVLLAVGPVFVVMALFRGTRGLTAGWLRGVVLTAITPLFVVVGGGMMLELLVPVVAALRSAEGIDGRAALALFLIASVHVALMAMVLKVAGAIISGWQVFGLAQAQEGERAGPAGGAVPAPASPAQTAEAAVPLIGRRMALVPQAAGTGIAGAETSAAPAVGSRTSRTVIQQAAGGHAPQASTARTRARGIGSRFQAATQRKREFIR
jgi:type IV secretion system protein VirB6